MHAAVVTSFGAPPRYLDFPVPVARGDGEIVVDVLASGLHPRVRSQADGSHYTSDGVLPLVPGIDGVGRAPDGRLLYFLLEETPVGAMAEQTVVDVRRSIALEDGTDPVVMAAAVNPAMSSWVALRRRIGFQVGQEVLVLGATGSAGRMAVQVARLFGASRVIGAGRNPDRLSTLTGLGATATVSLDGDPDGVADQLGQTAAGVDVVLDYVWGVPAAAAVAALVTRRADRGRPLVWISIGSVAGPTAPIPSAALRAARLQIVGSGQGSVGTAEIAAELPALTEAISTGALRVDARAVPLADVERVWAAGTETGPRVVLVP